MKWARLFLVLVLSIFMLSNTVRADDTQQDVLRDRTDEMMGRYNLYPAFEKLARGTGNLFLGFLEIPLAVDRRYSESNTIDSSLTGFAVGTFKGFVRTGVGLYEMVSFFLPYPEDYAPILPPLDYYDKKKRKRLPLE